MVLTNKIIRKGTEMFSILVTTVNEYILYYRDREKACCEIAETLNGI